MSEAQPDQTAVRVALWRALHVQVDPPPHVLDDLVGLAIAAPPAGWRERPDMNPEWTRGMRASIVARARFIEDLVEEQAARGVAQYVLLGAGLDTFAERRQDLTARVRVFEVDQPGTQAWKQRRLAELGIAVPESVRFVPIDFEAPWWPQLQASGFDPARPAVVASTGVAMYLTREANAATLRNLATLAPGSTFAMSFMLALELLPPDERALQEMVMQRAAAAGTPFLSLFAPDDLIALATSAGFRDARCVSPDEIDARYFAARSDGLRPVRAERLLVATT